MIFTLQHKAPQSALRWLLTWQIELNRRMWGWWRTSMKWVQRIGSELLLHCISDGAASRVVHGEDVKLLMRYKQSLGSYTLHIKVSLLKCLKKAGMWHLIIGLKFHTTFHVCRSVGTETDLSLWCTLKKTLQHCRTDLCSLVIVFDCKIKFTLDRQETSKLCVLLQQLE